MADSWLMRGNLRGPEGPPGTPGADGTSITGAVVNSSGDLILTLSTGAEINAGHVEGAPAPILNPETSVQSIADLPDAPSALSAFLVRDNGHWYVFEGDAGADDGKPGYTDVGPIVGAPGATGPAGADGADGVSVTGAAIDGAGHLILTLSQGGPIDAGVARGADGAQGPAGADGEPGTKIYTYATTPPAPSTARVGDLAIGANGDLLEAV